MVKRLLVESADDETKCLSYRIDQAGWAEALGHGSPRHRDSAGWHATTAADGLRDTDGQRGRRCSMEESCISGLERVLQCFCRSTCTTTVALTRTLRLAPALTLARAVPPSGRSLCGQEQPRLLTGPWLLPPPVGRAGHPAPATEAASHAPTPTPPSPFLLLVGLPLPPPASSASRCLSTV